MEVRLKNAQCQGDGYDALSGAQQDFLAGPKSWGKMTDEQRAWFGPGGGSAGSDFGLFAAESDACVAWNADDPASGGPCCMANANEGVDANLWPRRWPGGDK